METLFRTVLNMSATGAVVICVVLLARLALQRAPKRCAYWLWSAAAFRLVCPVSWKSALSIFSLASAAGAPVPAVSAGAGTSAIAYVPAASAAPVPTPTPVPTLLPQTMAESASAASAAAGAASAAPAATPLFVLSLVWLAGVAAMLIWGVVSYLRLSARLRTAVLLCPGVRQSDAVDSPFLMGFRNPQIYIPFGLSGERLDYVLAHERFHISRRDYLVKLLAFLILALHWFNPLVWLAFVLMVRDMEMRCDEAVLGRGEAKRTLYSETLLSFAVAGRFPGLGQLTFGEPGAKARIRNILRWSKPRPWVTVCAALLCAVAVAACAANPAERGASALPRVTPAPTTTPSPSPVETAAVAGPGVYTGVEDYIRAEILRGYEENGVTVFRADGRPLRADVTQTEITELARTGGLDGLAPEGELQSWRYRVRLKLAEDTPELMLSGAMTEENGWYDPEGAHDVVALCFPSGRLDVLYDRSVNDGMGFYGAHRSYEEAIYDWYVTENSLDLPLYVMDWGAALSAAWNYPVRRTDGDGWYLYVPVSDWTLTEWSDTAARWVSAYDTGSSLTVRAASAAEAAAEYEYPDGVAERFYAAADGKYWRVTTQYDPKIRVDSSWRGKEPEILERMTGSFRLWETGGAEARTGAGQAREAGSELEQTALWSAEVSMLGERFVSDLGAAGDWKDISGAFAERWCGKYLNASADSPFRCADAGIVRVGAYLNAASLTSTPRRLAFDVTLALGVKKENETRFELANAGWAVKNEHGMYELGAEAVLVSDDGVHWTVEAMNSGGSAGWGWRALSDSEQTKANIRYAIENEEATILLRFLPNLDWNDLDAGESAAAMHLLQDAAVSDEPEYADGKDQLYRDLYMLWGVRRADGAFAQMYLDCPDSILARQLRADPAAFYAALEETDAQTRDLVLRALGV